MIKSTGHNRISKYTLMLVTLNDKSNTRSADRKTQYTFIRFLQYLLTLPSAKVVSALTTTKTTQIWQILFKTTIGFPLTTTK